MTFRWGSLMTTPDGEIDLDRARVTVFLVVGSLGAMALIAGTLFQTFGHRPVEISGLLAMAGICVGPLMAMGAGMGLKIGAGKVADKATAKAIQAGTAPDRRAPITTETPVP